MKLYWAEVKSDNNTISGHRYRTKRGVRLSIVDMLFDNKLLGPEHNVEINMLSQDADFWTWLFP